MSIYDTKFAGRGWPEIESAMMLTPLHMRENNKRQAQLLNKWNLFKGRFHENYYSDRYTIENFQLNRVRHIVEWAYSNCHFYRTLYSDAGYEPGDIKSLKDFSLLPTITKDDLINHFPSGNVSCRHDLNKLRWMSTSGSSGKQVQMVLTEGRSDMDMIFKFRMLEIQSGQTLKPNDWLYNVHFVPWWHSSLLASYRVFSVKPECSAKSFFQHISHLKPAVISCMGSFTETLLSFPQPLKESGVNLISTNSESTTPQLRKKLSQHLGVNVLDEYSSEELDIIAFECPYHRYHLNEDDVYTEILKDQNNNIGRIIGTDLWNTAMPIIRYEQGDLAQANNFSQRCECGSSFRVVKKIHGRADQNFRTYTGKIILSSVLLDLCEQCFCIDPISIVEFRIIQRSEFHIEVMFIQNTSKLADKFFQHFEEKLNTIFGYTLKFTYSRLNSFPDTPSYKRKTFISEV